MFNFFVCLFCALGAVLQYIRGDIFLVVSQSLLALSNFMFAIPWLKKTLKKMKENIEKNRK